MWVYARLLRMRWDVRLIHSESFECNGCQIYCEIIRLTSDGATVALWGGRCGKWAGSQERIEEKRMA